MALRNQEYISVELFQYLFYCFFHFPCKRIVVSIVLGSIGIFNFSSLGISFSFMATLTVVCREWFPTVTPWAFCDEIKLFPFLMISA